MMRAEPITGLRVAAVFAWLVLAAAPTAACRVPVFRYALERWPASPYEVVVFHRGPLSAEGRAAVDWLKKVGRSDSPDAIIIVRTVDLNGDPDGKAAALWETQTSAILPWLVVRYPPAYRMPKPVWAGPLTAENAMAVADSPARRGLARRVLQGESAVFVLLESGEPDKDEAAARLLQDELKRMEQQLKLPKPVQGLWDDPKYDAQGAPDLRLAFSVLRVSRSDPAERVFVRMLLESEADLKTFAEPIAFPTYGRGRVLYALVGGGINRDNIGEACRFTVGACSCITKESNPGTDMLMAADWDAALEAQGSAMPEVELPELTGLSRFVPPPEAGPSEGAPALVRNILLAVAGGVVTVAVVALALRRKERASRK